MTVPDADNNSTSTSTSSADDSSQEPPPISSLTTTSDLDPYKLQYQQTSPSSSSSPNTNAANAPQYSHKVPPPAHHTPCLRSHNTNHHCPPARHRTMHITPTHSSTESKDSSRLPNHPPHPHAKRRWKSTLIHGHRNAHRRRHIPPHQHHLHHNYSYKSPAAAAAANNLGDNDGCSYVDTPHPSSDSDLEYLGISDFAIDSNDHNSDCDHVCASSPSSGLDLISHAVVGRHLQPNLGNGNNIIYTASCERPLECPPEKQGHYVIHEHCDRITTNMSTVSFGICLNSWQRVVFKTVKDHALAERELGYIRRVADIPNVVPLLDTFDDMSGHKIAVFPRLRPLPLLGLDLAEVRRVALCLLKTLREIHARGIVHLDVNPSNIMAGKKMCPCLIDFGLAADIGTWVSRGTSGFTAPEVLDPTRASKSPLIPPPSQSSIKSRSPAGSGIDDGGNACPGNDGLGRHHRRRNLLSSSVAAPGDHRRPPIIDTDINCASRGGDTGAGLPPSSSMVSLLKLNPDAKLDGRADVYSAGIVFGMMVAKFFPGSDLYYLGGSKVHVHVTDSIIEQLTRALRWLDYMPPNLDPDPLMITRTTARMSPAQAPVGSTSSCHRASSPISYSRTSSSSSSSLSLSSSALVASAATAKKTASGGGSSSSSSNSNSHHYRNSLHFQSTQPSNIAAATSGHRRPLSSQYCSRPLGDTGSYYYDDNDQMLSSYYSNSYGLTSSILNDEDSGYDTSSQPSMASSMHYYQMSVGIHPANNGMHVGYPFPRTPHHHNHYPQNHPHFMAALSGSVDRVLRQPPHHFGLQKDGQRQKVARATKIPQAVLHAADLLCRMLNANPDNRPTASQVLSHPFFSESGDWFVNTRQGDIDIWKDEIREAIQDSSDPHHGLATSSKSQYTYNGIETFNSDVLASPVAAGAIGNGNSGGGGDKDMHASAARTTTSYADDALSDDSCYFAAGMDIDAYLRYCD